ncbi:Ndd.3 hypothetical predicted inner membrane protein [Escherichia phage T4]|uniref:Ndd.3 hypothetical predicted inner membrane protein n=1 Tax=Enterobacteria phage T4 TaxID=10665 RepID=Q9T0S5_BPT4|nr:Ndd.3 hypothetical predicted inner membrane protein [Escherichia phage T4]AAD42619.1 Ndd.3 hypothetical predicted inner membrane protein [Escherichia phage T4]
MNVNAVLLHLLNGFSIIFFRLYSFSC